MASFSALAFVPYNPLTVRHAVVRWLSTFFAPFLSRDLQRDATVDTMRFPTVEQNFERTWQTDRRKALLPSPEILVPEAGDNNVRAHVASRHGKIRQQRTTS